MSGSQSRSYVALSSVLLLLLFAADCMAQTLITTIPTGGNPVAVGLNPVTNKIYVANQSGNSLTVINGATNQATNVFTGSGPDALDINPVTNKIYVADGGASAVTVIDGATNRTASVSTGVGPVAVAVNPATNQIYVANYYSNSVTVIHGATNQTTTVNVGTSPYSIAVNPVTNKIFVADSASQDVAIIDGATNSVTTVAVGTDPVALAVNQNTNQIYVANYRSSNVSIIDGTSYSVTNIAVGPWPCALAVDPVRNQIFVANGGANSGTIIDGTTLITTPISVGDDPTAVAVDVVTGKVYFANDVWLGTLAMLDETTGNITSVNVGNYDTGLALNPVPNTLYVIQSIDNQVSVVAGGSADPLQFVPVAPCRVVDTRGPDGPLGGQYLLGATSRSFPVQQSPCSVPNSALAYSLNVTVVPHTRNLGYLTIWPTGEAQPVVSTLNSPDGRVKANAAIVLAGEGGALSVYASDATDVILDIDGYFQAPAQQTLQFYPVPLCRAFDTRWATGSLGGPSLQGGQERDFPILASSCQLPSNALAYSMNFTVVPVGGSQLSYLTVWPAGSSQPVVSTLNNPTATTLANAAIVPAGVNGAIAVYAANNTELIGDVNGYFAAPATGGLSLYPLLPCRVIDTRSNGGAFSGQRHPPVNVTASACGIPAAAQEFVFNATVVPVGGLGYLTLWGDGDPMPGVSNLNATDGLAASNMAIIPNLDGESDAYAYGTTQLILDIASYFAP